MDDASFFQLYDHGYEYTNMACVLEVYSINGKTIWRCNIKIYSASKCYKMKGLKYCLEALGAISLLVSLFVYIFYCFDKSKSSYILIFKSVHVVLKILL